VLHGTASVATKASKTPRMRSHAICDRPCMAPISGSRVPLKDAPSLVVASLRLTTKLRLCPSGAKKSPLEHH